MSLSRSCLPTEEFLATELLKAATGNPPRVLRGKSPGLKAGSESVEHAAALVLGESVLGFIPCAGDEPGFVPHESWWNHDLNLRKNR